MAISMDIAGHEVRIDKILALSPLNESSFTVLIDAHPSISAAGNPSYGWDTRQLTGYNLKVCGTKEDRARIVKAMRTGEAPDDDA